MPPERPDAGLDDPVERHTAISTAEKVRFLRSPGAYAHGPDRVETVETHMSWVFLAGNLVFKLKKPVRFPFLDFTSLQRREHAVREEVRLNRRLAPGVYLGVSALTLGPDGMAIDGEGDVLDWLVRMRRLPEALLLDRLVRRGAAIPRMIDRVADTLVEFYARANRAATTAEARIEHFAQQFRQDAAVLLDPAFGLNGERVGHLVARSERALDRLSPVLTAQADEGRLVDGHGDLRPEHVCLTEPPAIFDCIEFSPALRIVDPFEEIAFLGLECARLGADWITPALHARLSGGLARPVSPEVSAFYWRARGLLRARLALAHLLDDRPRTPERWRPLALAYVGLAERAEEVMATLDARHPRSGAGSPR